MDQHSNDDNFGAHEVDDGPYCLPAQEPRLLRPSQEARLSEMDHEHWASSFLIDELDNSSEMFQELLDGERSFSSQAFEGSRPTSMATGGRSLVMDGIRREPLAESLSNTLLPPDTIVRGSNVIIGYSGKTTVEMEQKFSMTIEPCFGENNNHHPRQQQQQQKQQQEQQQQQQQLTLITANNDQLYPPFQAHVEFHSPWINGGNQMPKPKSVHCVFDFESDENELPPPPPMLSIGHGGGGSVAAAGALSNRFGPAGDSADLIHLHRAGPVNYRSSAPRVKKTPEQLRHLEKSFASNQYPAKDERARLAKKINLSDNSIRLWFQHKRNKHRRQHQQYSFVMKREPNSEGC